MSSKDLNIHSIGSMLAVPRKDGFQVNYSSHLFRFLTLNYDLPEIAFEEGITRLNLWKTQSIENKSPASNMESLESYYWQLEKIAAKFPFNDQAQIPCSFTWKDAFTQKSTTTKNDVWFELRSLVFNIGVTHSTMGQGFPAHGDGLKNSCASFQKAAGAFTYIKENLNKRCKRESSQVDTSDEMLSALVSLCLAQAQESFFLKGVEGGMNGGVLSKLATQCFKFYEECVHATTSPTLKSAFSKQWINYFQGKHFYYQAMAHYYFTLKLHGEAQYGKGLAHLNAAKACLESAVKPSKYAGLQIKELIDKVNALHTSSVHDNNTIYNDRVPPAPAELAGAAMVKAATFEVKTENPDYFAALVPISVRRTHAEYQGQVNRLVQNVHNDLDSCITMCLSELQHIGVPACLDALETPIGVPRELLEASNKAKSTGGVTEIMTNLEGMKTANQNSDAMLVEALRILDEEESEDSGMRARYGREWTRTPSSQLTKDLRQEGAGHQQKLQVALNADNSLRQECEKNYEFLNVLSKPEELEKMLPSGNNANLPPDVQALSNRIRELYGNLKNAQTANEEIKKKLHDFQAEDQIVSELSKLSLDGGDEQTVINKGIEGYNVHRNAASEAIKQQRQILDEIKTMTADFQNRNESQSRSQQRETVLKNLGMASSIFSKVSKNVESGQKFYSEIINRLLRFQSKCTDFATARKSEMDDAIADIERRQNPPARPPAPTAQPQRPGQPPQRPPSLSQQPQQPQHQHQHQQQQQQQQPQQPQRPPQPGYPQQQQQHYQQQQQPYGQQPPYGQQQQQQQNYGGYGGYPTAPPTGSYGGYPPQQNGYPPQQAGYPPQGYYPPQPQYGQQPQQYGQQPPYGQQPQQPQHPPYGNPPNYPYQPR